MSFLTFISIVDKKNNGVKSIAGIQREVVFRNEEDISSAQLL